MEPDILIARIAACLLLVAALASCEWGRSDKPPPPVPGTRLDLPEGSLGTTAWLADGYVYVVHSSKVIDPYRLWRAAPGRPPQPVALPNLPECRRTSWVKLTALLDERLGLARYCSMEDPRQSHIDSVAYDPKTQRVELLAPLGEYNPTSVSWHKDLTSGYVSYGTGVCAGFAPLRRKGIGRFPNPITIDGHTWQVDQVFFDRVDTDCRAQGRAEQALLTRDERRLVFLASPESQGNSGQVREIYPWHVYEQELPDGQPRRVVRGFSDTRGVALAPDGRTLAVAGLRGKEQGLWLVDLDSGNMRKLTGAVFSSPAFSPDGRQLAVVRFLDDEHAELRVLNVDRS